MTLTTTELTQTFVCLNCRLRKKKCDRKQPSCGYCAQKKLDCQYPSDGEYLQPQPKPLLVAPTPLLNSSLLLSTTLSEALLSQPTNMDSLVYLQVLRIIRSSGQEIDDLVYRYFRGVHTAIPLVSYYQFFDTLHDCQPPPASFSVLLLSMCLATHHPMLIQNATMIKTECLYSATKAFFAQAQASLPLSLSIIQAGVIISLFELASDRVYEAFASIGNCARLGYTARLHLAEAGEEANTWWGIIICERIIFCEILDFQQPLATIAPEKASLPKDPVGIVYKVEHYYSPPPEPSSDEDAGGFACMVQSALFMDRLFKTLQIADLETRLSRLDTLDQAMRAFFSSAIELSQTRVGPFSNTYAMIERAIFISQFHIIDQVQHIDECAGKTREQWIDNAHTILDSVVRMLVTALATYTHLEIQFLDYVSPSSVFLGRHMIRYLEHKDNATWEDSKRLLQVAVLKYEFRWKPDNLEARFLTGEI